MPIEVLSRLVIPELATLGDVLTADAAGEATWQPPAGASAFTPKSLVTPPAAIVASEVSILSASLAAGLLKAGTTFRLKAAGVMTVGVTAGTMIARARIGTSGALTDAVAAIHNVVPVASRTSIPFLIEFLVTCRTAGAGGTIIGSGTLDGSAVSTTGTTTGQTATAAVNTTVANTLQVTLQGSSGHSHTVHVATIELVVP